VSQGVDRAAARAAIRDFLVALGHDPEQPDLALTAERVTDAFADELLSGYAVDVAELVRSGSEPHTGSNADPVVLDELAVVTVCPHHLLVAEGVATVAYVPGERVVGFGAVARLVDAVSRRLTLQEVIAPAVAEALMEYAGARGACVRLVMNHACLRARGPVQSRARAISVAARGCLESPERWEPLLRVAGAAEVGRTGESP
jgi:GTP cyclohydrolase I